MTARALGILGDPVGHSLSPLMHNRALDVLGLDAVYLPFHVRPDHLSAALRGVAALGMLGVNLTIPHKEAALPLMDELSDEARLVGAVNTVHQVDGRLVGHNTDGRGFVRSLREEAGVDPKGLCFVLVGAGGAARAVAVRLGLEGAGRVVIANRTAARAERLARRVQSATGVRAEGVALNSGAVIGGAAGGADVVINGTPLGMVRSAGTVGASSPAPSRSSLPLSLELLSPGALVCDLVYVPRRTAWLEAAARAGHPTLSGLGMLLYQGAIALETWTGRCAPVAAMRQALEEGLARPL